MADLTITQLPADATLTGAEEVPIMDGGITKKTTVQDIANLAAGGVSSVNGETGIVVLDATDVGADAAGTASGLLAAHVAAADPHPGYLTPAEGNAAYAPIAHSNIVDGNPHGTNWDQIESTATKIPFNTSLATQTLSAGEIAWNPDERTFDMGVNGVTLQAGQEIIINVRNNTLATIPNGTVCMATGAIGASGRITVAPMDGTNPANAMYLLGIATEDIAAGADGFVTVFGKVRGLNTSAWSEGDVLYTSTTTAGALTNVAPTTGLKQPIAIVINAAVNGTLFVRIETIDNNKFEPKGTIVTTGDGSKYLANDGTYKTVTSGASDHGSLTGLADDDHTQYLNETRHDLLDHTGLTGIPTQYTDEMAQDAIGTLITNGTQSGITVFYDDANNKLDFTVTASGSGDVTGPASSVDNNFALFDGTTGKVIKDTGVKASDFATASHNHSGVYEPANANIQSHINSTSNPHFVTAAQLGFGNKSTLDKISESVGLPTWNGGAWPSTAPVHNDLSGLQGGTAGEYYHLTDAELTKLSGIEAGAQVNVNADWNAVSGDAQILNKPDTFTPSAHTIGSHSDWPATVDMTEVGYLDGVTSGIQAQIDNKQDTLVSGTNIKTVNSTSLLGSGDVTVQPTLISGINIKTINTQSILGSGDLTISGAVSDGDKGDVTVSGGGATWTVVVKDPYAFFKSDTASVAFTKTGAGTISIKAGTYVLVATSMVSFSAATAVVMPTHTIGTDYYIYACTDGTVRADANATAPTGYTTANSRKIGGYHYGRIRNSLTVTDVAIEIVPRSLWDLTYRPKCNPAGMVDVYGNGHLWADIYQAAVDSAITLTSGVLTAGTAKSIYNGTPLTGTEGLNGYNFIELAKNSGKRLLSYSEWCAVAHGSPQGNNGDNLNAWSMTTNTARTGTGQVARAVSFCGACDCVGNVWEWLDEFSNDHATTAYAWQNPMTGQNVGQLYIPNATGLRQYLVGGCWSDGVLAGSRALNAIEYPWSAGLSIGSRFACDGL